MNKGYRLLEPTSEMGIEAGAESCPKELEAMARGLTMMLYWFEHNNPVPEEPRIDTLQDGIVMGDLAKQGILMRAFGRATVTNERHEAYKNVEKVVKVVEHSGPGRIAARLTPMAVVKG